MSVNLNYIVKNILEITFKKDAIILLKGFKNEMLLKNRDLVNGS